MFCLYCSLPLLQKNQAGANQNYFLNEEDLILKVKKASAENSPTEKKKSSTILWYAYTPVEKNIYKKRNNPFA